MQTFMEKVVEECSSDNDFVWIHDYHLLVLPSLLRKRFNKIRLGGHADSSWQQQFPAFVCFPGF